MDTIVIIDFGGQTTQLIARRIREAGVYTEIMPFDTPAERLDPRTVKGIVLSGSPYSVYAEDAPVPDAAVFSLGLPVLGICYGMHLLIQHFSGRVLNHPTREFGKAAVRVGKENPLFTGVPREFNSWMSHGDSIAELPAGFSVAAESDAYPAAVFSEEKNIYGLQFHPEVTHCEYGTEILTNFAVNICGCNRDWTMEHFVEDETKRIRKQVGNGKVLLLISGGVDSSVTAALLLHTLDPDRVHLLYIDTGLMRKNETGEVAKILSDSGARHIHIVDAEDEFLHGLKGETDPEKKREIIGDLFITLMEREIRKLRIPDAILAQGTLYTDMIESGKGVGNKAKVIKSHHNVRSPLIEEKRNRGLVIEPLSLLYKDEVRKLGRYLKLPDSVVNRHPFPGPGLGVRILGEVTKEKCDILREADAIYIEELKKRGLYTKIWQAFAVLLPIRTVGVTGDERHYGYVVSLRGVVSFDGMTADVYPFDMQDLLEIANRITNNVREAGRVVYDISSKPPATIEWE